jgi:hypothetical protein
MALNVEDNLFSAKQIDNIAIVSFKKNLIRQLTTKLYPIHKKTPLL